MKAIDLFCGCGGLSLGFEQAGIEMLAGLDNWKPAIEVYRANFNHPVIEQDLNDENSTIEILNNFTFDMIVVFSHFKNDGF